VSVEFVRCWYHTDSLFIGRYMIAECILLHVILIYGRPVNTPRSIASCEFMQTLYLDKPVNWVFVSIPTGIWCRVFECRMHTIECRIDE